MYESEADGRLFVYSLFRELPTHPVSLPSFRMERNRDRGRNDLQIELEMIKRKQQRGQR